MRVTMNVLQSKCPDRIREIEMAVDAVVFDQGVSMQFWQDVRLCGLREAYLYLRNYAKQGMANAERVEAFVIPLCDTVIAEVSPT